MKKILLVCTGNTCRSVMAKALFEQFAKDMGIPLQVESVGLSVYISESATQQAIEVMSDYGINISEHRSKQIQYDKLQDYDLILTMTQDHKHHIINQNHELTTGIYTLREYAAKLEQESIEGMEKVNKMIKTRSGLQWDVKDPYGQSVEIYTETASELAVVIKKILSRWQ